MIPVYLSLGSNLGNRLENLAEAIVLLRACGCRLLKASSVYESAAAGFFSENRFLNLVIAVETSYKPEGLLQEILNVEKKLGRIRLDSGYSDRTIDIDILFYSHEIIKKPDLQIPHPRLHERKFVLKPLSEIAPNFFHPKLNNSVMHLYDICEDEEKPGIIVSAQDFHKILKRMMPEN